MTVLAYAQAELPGGLAAQVAALEAQAWPGAGGGHDPALAPKVMVLVDEGGTVTASSPCCSRRSGTRGAPTARPGSARW